MQHMGTHLVAELTGCRFEDLDSVDFVRRALVRAAAQAKATVLDASFHKFSPQGVSGVVVLAESHSSIHTWPEHGYAAVDVFTCGDQAMPEKAIESIVESFEPEHYAVREIPRGIPAARKSRPAAASLPLDLGEGA
ncbi:MAG: adenosylmethionine decarboxylase [Deltaproteobacteria bacterium]|nr:adenosylmethionine decarboxylase [Deltaproteobacteria bacterium]